MTSLPSGACDCHVHVVGANNQYPMVQDRQYTPGPASTVALRAHMSDLGLTRSVIIQPSFYGADNTCMVDALTQLNTKQANSARGVAVVGETVAFAQLQQLAAHGVRGLRLNLESAGHSSPQSIGRALHLWADLIAPLGWHIQLFASLAAIAGAAPTIEHLHIPVVLDHFALIDPTGDPHDAATLAVLALVASGKAYVKLSAPYRLASPNASAISALAQRLIQTNPTRILWGSDWPHTNREPGKSALQVSQYREISLAFLRTSIDDWLPTPTLQQQILVTNPGVLYGF
jgi:2-pyrone-4,6-dicarboxylate lactonase